MKNGTTACRKYYVLVDSEGGEIIRNYFSRLETVMKGHEILDLDDLRHKFKKADSVTLNGRYISEEQVTEEFLLALADAIAADCEAGSMVQIGAFHPGVIEEASGPAYSTRMLQLDISRQLDDIHREYYYVNIYADCENILSVLGTTDILESIRKDLVYG